MPDVFISYSTKDSPLALKLAETLRLHQLEVFLAETSIVPGTKWKESIIDSFRESRWVFFLATPTSCRSQAVMHELGGVLMMQKNLICLMHDVEPSELPSWIRDVQAVGMNDPERVNEVVQKVAEAVRNDKFKAGLVAGGVLLFLAWMSGK